MPPIGMSCSRNAVAAPRQAQQSRETNRTASSHALHDEAAAARARVMPVNSIKILLAPASVPSFQWVNVPRDGKGNHHAISSIPDLLQCIKTLTPRRLPAS